MKKIIIAIASVILFSSCMKTMEVYTIIAESNDPSLGTVTGGGNYVEGGTAVLTATPSPGCIFDHWTYDYPPSTDNPLKFIVRENKSITAVFKSNASVVVSDGSGWNNKPEYYRCDLDVASKKMIYESKPTATSSNELIHLEFSWDGTIRTGIFSGHTDVDFATTQVSNGWGGYYEEIDLAASHISLGNPLLWDASKPYGYESYGSSISIGSVSVGNFLAKDVTLKITSIDPNNMLVSFVAEATMVNIAKCVETNTSWDEAATSKLKVEATDIPLVVY